MLPGRIPPRRRNQDDSVADVRCSNRATNTSCTGGGGSRRRGGRGGARCAAPSAARRVGDLSWRARALGCRCVRPVRQTVYGSLRAQRPPKLRFPTKACGLSPFLSRSRARNLETGIKPHGSSPPALCPPASPICAALHGAPSLAARRRRGARAAPHGEAHLSNLSSVGASIVARIILARLRHPTLRTRPRQTAPRRTCPRETCPRPPCGMELARMLYVSLVFVDEFWLAAPYFLAIAPVDDSAAMATQYLGSSTIAGLDALPRGCLDGSPMGPAIDGPLVRGVPG